jgi:hypothetical protein
MDPDMQTYFHSCREARKVTLRSVGDEYKVGNTGIPFVLNAEWQQHNIRMLTTTYRKVCYSSPLARSRNAFYSTD